MHRFGVSFVALSTLLFVSILPAQQTSTTATTTGTTSSTTVPNLIRYSGTLKDAQGAASVAPTTVGVTFAIYKQQDGGAAVWQETQNVTLDASGQYSVILGSTTSAGLPDDLFSQQEQRWLGVQVQGQAEQARVLLVSVPYAFKAHEAETLGGLPPSAFVKAPPTEASGSGATGAVTGTSVNALSTAGKIGGNAKSTGTSAKPAVCPPDVTTTTGGPPSVIPMWDVAGCNLVNSIMSQVGVARIDVNGDFNVVATKSFQIGSSNVLTIPGTDNLFVGVGAGASNAGTQNTFVGANAATSNTSGNYNTVIGEEAGFFKNVGDHNTFAGYRAGYRNHQGNFNAFFGDEAGHYNNGNNNVFVGRAAGFGPLNYAGNQGSNNTLVGAEAGRNTSGYSNTFVGYQAGYRNTTGGGNTFIGLLAGSHHTTTGGNTFIGLLAGYSNITGAYNTFSGIAAGVGNNGNGNTFLGYNSGLFTDTGDFDIYLGSTDGAGAPGESHTIRIGTLQQYFDDEQCDPFLAPCGQDATYIAGIYDSNATVAKKATDLVVCVNPDGGLYGAIGGTTCTLSSRRFKEQIANMGDSSSKLFQLRPVTFFYKPQYDDGSHLPQYGLIAEEVATVYPELVAYDKDGQPYSVKYQLLAPMLLNELQKQHTVVAAQQDVIKTQQEQINDLQQRLSRLESLIERK